MPSPSWPGKLPVRQVRIARPTDQLDEFVASTAWSSVCPSSR
jgi:hypothetical protein